MCPLSCDLILCVQTQVHKIYRENRFSHVKQKQARKATIAQLIIDPYLVQKTYIYSRGHDSSVGIVCVILQTLNYITVSVCTVGDSHRLMNSKQMVKRTNKSA